MAQLNLSEPFAPTGNRININWGSTSASIAIDTSLAIAWLQLEGAIAVRHIIEVSDAELSHPDFTDGMDTIWDMRQADLRAVTPDAMLEILRRVKPRHSRLAKRAAFLVDSDLQFGIIRMWQVYGQDVPQDREIFRDSDDALKWLIESR
ncbi:MAG: hypothetical protein WD002_03125 [Pseudomonadales bacterium]